VQALYIFFLKKKIQRMWALDTTYMVINNLPDIKLMMAGKL
jgi:hypothetical protein